MERNTFTTVIGWIAAGLLVSKSVIADSAAADASNLDIELTRLIKAQNISSIYSDKGQSTEKVALGRALFFDKVLSGSGDIACATCHHPNLHSGDDLSLSIGVGGDGLGYERKLGKARPLIPRNAPEIFNRGASQWRTMFWDGRVEIAADGHRISPADEKLPADKLENIVAMQAMFPVTSRHEMRGRKGDLDVSGQPNTLAAIGDTDFEEIWERVMGRVLAIPEYVALFKQAYPELATDELHYAHAANALAAFQTKSFTFEDSPWDRYLRGEQAALPEAAKQGAILFYGSAGCSSCHSGALMTDQKFYNLLVPQIGPGHRDSSGFDIGRARVTDQKKDAFAFRTPPLRNVAITGPWMHNGSYMSLEAVIEHHAKPLEMLQAYDASQLDPSVKKTFRLNTSTILVMSQTFSPEINVVPELNSQETEQLIAFLESLTSPSTQDLSYLVPQTVPSGLPVDR
ncbi:di-heme cytochrome c peroxidase [Oleiphilus messinensis]|uniref:Di-heme cytochrome c peroxidase n=1 Tax=Oleiphilus messinensis TaxID=141451 RepID=A0A1Y0I630_9GAMM|nr:cytochrome c peroxidase [Oleiphilus messinensis]ARU55246.1 di-heme cytochrome c peroxidase [Oleiphilus messinensis]